MKGTSIEWTDATFNPWIGCTKVSPGCKNCYAAARDARHMLGPVSHWGPGAPRHITSKAYWRQPLAWAKQAQAEGRRIKVFCASQADVFDAEALKEQRLRLWDLIGGTFDWLDWQLVTKRPERIQEVISEDKLNWGFFELTRCWLITSTENQETADKRIPALVDIPAAVHGISAEPLLEPINLWTVLFPQPALDWVIVGGESGHGARRCDSEWIGNLVLQCRYAKVPCFVKQLGAHHPAPGDKKGGDILFWPEHLRVREFPEVRP